MLAPWAAKAWAIWAPRPLFVVLLVRMGFQVDRGLSLFKRRIFLFSISHRCLMLIYMYLRLGSLGGWKLGRQADLPRSACDQDIAAFERVRHFRDD
jgi:hypothetical protein